MFTSTYVLYVCICVCIRTYVHMFSIRISVGVNVHMYLCGYYTHTYLCAYLNTYTCAPQGLCTQHIRQGVHPHVCQLVRSCICTCVHVVCTYILYLYCMYLFIQSILCEVWDRGESLGSQIPPTIQFPVMIIP